MQPKSARAEPQGNAALVGVEQAISSLLRGRLAGVLSLQEIADREELLAALEQDRLRADAVVLGASLEGPVQTAQRVHAFDKHIPLFILSRPGDCLRLKQTLVFTPFLGADVTPWSVDDVVGLPEAVRLAALRRRQRRTYQSTIASAQLRLGELTLFQPEVTHYLDRLLDHAPIGVLTVDLSGTILSINRWVQGVLKVNEREVLGIPLTELFPEAEGDRLLGLLKRCNAAAEDQPPQMFEIAPCQGERRIVEITTAPLVHRTGRRGAMLILQDVTGRVKAERERMRAEEDMRRLSMALEQTADTVMITDYERYIEYVNPAFEQLTGYSKEEVIGKKTYFLRSGVHDEAFYDELWNVISTGGVYRGVLVNRKRDGSLFYEEKTISPLRDTQGNITHFISTGRDITEQKKAEEAARAHQAELAHVGRLSTLGEMTSGLAHELNQPLCAITTYAQTCLRVIQEKDCRPDQVRYGLEQIVKQAELAGEIFRRLRDFARKGDFSRRRVILAHVVREALNFVRAEAVLSEVSLKIESRGKAPVVEVDPIQIEQVLLNLARNSMDAMAGKPAGAKKLTIRISRAGKDQAKVCVSDTGHGCAPEVVERLFEPFFTTKPNGLGIGLGLSQSIIEAHGGRLWLESNTPEGATFCFTLPAQEEGADENENSGEGCHGLYR